MYLLPFYIYCSRSVVILIIAVVISYLIYLVCKGYQKLTYQKWLQRVSPIVSTKSDEESGSQINSKNGEQFRQNSLNTQKYNPEVCEVKIYIIITLIFVTLCCTFAVLYMFGSPGNFFPIFQFFARFMLSVVIPLVIYCNNPTLRTFVYEMFTAQM